jgi:hypothetical protein
MGPEELGAFSFTPASNVLAEKTMNVTHRILTNESLALGSLQDNKSLKIERSIDEIALTKKGKTHDENTANSSIPSFKMVQHTDAHIKLKTE